MQESVLSFSKSKVLKKKSRSFSLAHSKMFQRPLTPSPVLELNLKNKAKSSKEDREVLKLIDQVLAGDDSAFESLLEKYQKLISYVVSRFLFDPEQTEEIIQLVLINLYESLGKYKPVGTFSSWVSALARHQCLMYVRKKKLIHSHLSHYQKLIEHNDELEKPERDNIYLNALSQCMEHVNTKNSKILKLKYEKGLSFEEISSFIGKSADTTRRLVSRVRAKLKECIELKVGIR